MFLIQGRGGGQEREALSVDVFVSGIRKARIVAGSKGLALSEEENKTLTEKQNKNSERGMFAQWTLDRRSLRAV